MGTRVVAIAIAGALGALARLAMQDYVRKFAAHSFPWGTFLVNCSGCFIFGVIWELAEAHMPPRFAISSEMRFILLVGFCGAFTTFSSFAHDNINLLRSGQWLYLTANVVGQNLLGVLCLAGGMALTKSLS